MKVLWQANAPWVPSGYGQQTALFAPRIRDLGHSIAIAATAGLVGGSMDWRGIRILPTYVDRLGKDILAPHAGKVFGSYRGGTVITLMDVWVYKPQDVHRVNWAPWTPIDHEPCPPPVTQILSAGNAMPIAMSKFGHKAMVEAGLKPYYVPHGVDLKTFTPMPRDKARAELNWPQDKFIVGMVGMNKGRPSRKSFPQAIEAFKIFYEKHDDALLYLHSEASGSAADGLDLRQILTHNKLPSESAMFCAQYDLAIGFPTTYMNRMYNAFDVLLMPSSGEGFGIPILEAQACFPAETQAAADSILQSTSRLYSGPLIHIKTKRGLLRATAEHPFYTNKGWVSASSLTPEHLLLYCSQCNEEYIHRGRISDLSRPLPKTPSEGSSQTNGSTLQLRALAEAQTGHSQTTQLHSHTEESKPEQTQTSLHGRHDRRRRHSYDSEDLWQMEASSLDSQHLHQTHGVVRADNQPAISNLAGAFESEGALPVSHYRDRPSANFPANTTLLSHQEGAYGSSHSVDSTPTAPEQGHSIDSQTARDHLNHQGAQLEAISSIEISYVTDLPVYNLATHSGTYLAEGYVVHNCGTPVITTNWTSMPELTRAGWCVEGTPYYTSVGAWWKLPHVPEIADALEDAYDNRDSKTLRETGREFAMEYEIERVTKDFMSPVLQQIERKFDFTAVAAKQRGETPKLQEGELISVVVVTKDPTSETATKCFKALKASTVPYELIVINREKEWTFASAANQGLKAAKGNYLLLLNDDCYVEPETLGHLQAACKHDVGVVGGLLFYPDGRIQHAGGYIDKKGDDWDFNHILLHSVAPPDSHQWPRTEVEYITGALLMTRRDVMERVDYLDERYLTGYEDSDYCLMVREAGYRILLEPLAKAIHVHSATRAQNLEADQEKAHASRMAFKEKHGH